MQPESVQEEFLDSLDEREIQELEYCWEFWGRPDQQAPQWDWFIWFILCGRGWGKTRTGAEWVIDKIKQGLTRVNLAARTSGDIRKTMIEGESGIIARAPPDLKPKYMTSLKELHWPATADHPNGRISLCFSADEPDQGRGPQSEALWCDELAAWGNEKLWHNLFMACRIGDKPQILVTTTGRRSKFLKALTLKKGTHLTRGHTLDNRGNLAPRAVAEMLEAYEGTELGRQELGGDILDDKTGAYWELDSIPRILRCDLPALEKVVIGLDPAITNNRRSDLVGIVVVGIGYDGIMYVLEDLSRRAGPAEWADLVLGAYIRHRAQKVLAESNRGGDLIEHTLREAAAGRNLEVHIETMNSQEGKSGRAEPVSTMYAKGRVKHVGNDLAELEDEMTDWIPSETPWSPNRIDALCFACNDLSPNFGAGFESVRVEPGPGHYGPASLTKTKSGLLVPRPETARPRKGGKFWR